MSLAPGARLGPYEIVAPLGAGGMGEVYRAKDTRLGRDVAVKVLPQHLSSNPEIRARFEREAKTVSSLNHPNICTLFDVGREGETDYLVTSACRPLPGVRDGDEAAGWSADGKSLFVYRRDVIPVQVDRLDAASGVRSVWKTVPPVYAAVCGLNGLIAAPDGAFVYGYARTRSELYVIKGLK